MSNGCIKDRESDGEGDRYRWSGGTCYIEMKADEAGVKQA